jgi:site-specific DNA recombinase
MVRGGPDGRSWHGTRLVIGDGAANTVDAGLATLIGEAFATRQTLLSGSYDSIEALAQRLGVNRAYLTSLVRLSYLSPEIVRAILEGRHPVELNSTRLMALGKDLPHDWPEQRRFLGFKPV